jgi:hypothetical protein
MDVLYIKIGVIIIGSLSIGIAMIYFGFKYYFKNESKKPKIREIKSIIPDGWVGNLIKLIVNKSQKQIKNEGFSNIYIWEKGKYILTCKELFNSNDKDWDIISVSYPILTTFIVTIEEKRKLLPKLVTYISVDRTKMSFKSDDPLDFEKEFEERLNKKPNVYVSGVKVL